MAFAIYVLLFIGLFVGILNVLPTAEVLDPAFANAITTMVQYLKAWDFIFATSDLLKVFGLWIALEVGIYTWKIFKRVMGTVGGVRGG